MKNPDEFAHEVYELQKQWAELDGAARSLEKLEKVVLSEIISREDGPITKAEHKARASKAYRQHIEKMVAARTTANLKKAEVEGRLLAYEIWRTKSATKRAEMNLR